MLIMFKGGKKWLASPSQVFRPFCAKLRVTRAPRWVRPGTARAWVPTQGASWLQSSAPRVWRGA